MQVPCLREYFVYDTALSRLFGAFQSIEGRVKV